MLTQYKLYSYINKIGKVHVIQRNFYNHEDATVSPSWYMYDHVGVKTPSFDKVQVSKFDTCEKGYSTKCDTVVHGQRNYSDKYNYADKVNTHNQAKDNATSFDDTHNDKSRQD